MAGKKNKCMSLGRHELHLIGILVFVFLSAFRDDNTVSMYAVGIRLREIRKIQ